MQLFNQQEIDVLEKAHRRAARLFCRNQALFVHYEREGNVKKVAYFEGALERLQNTLRSNVEVIQDTKAIGLRVLGTQLKSVSADHLVKIAALCAVGKVVNKDGTPVCHRQYTSEYWIEENWRLGFIRVA